MAYAQLASEAPGKASHPHVVHKAAASGAATGHKESTQLVSLHPLTTIITTTFTLSQPPAKLVVIGSAAVDITARADPVPGGARSKSGLHTTAPGIVSLTSGGVGRNVAEAAHRILSSQSKDLSHSTVLLSPIGEDAFGQFLVSESEKIGMRTDGLMKISAARTAVCNMVLDSAGGLTGGVADMDVIRSLEASRVSGHSLRYRNARDDNDRLLDYGGLGQASPYHYGFRCKHVP